MSSKNTDNNKPELSPEKKAKLLARCESEIRKERSAFVSAAKAVFTIIDQNLWQPDYETHHAYFAEKWDMTETDISRYRKGWILLKNLEEVKDNEGNRVFTGEQMPTNEGQARALRSIEPLSRQVDVWKQALASGERVTAKLISNLANPPQSNAPVASPILQLATPPETTEILASATHECSAVIEIEIDSSVLKDALEYKGVICIEVRPNIYSFEITSKDRESLLHELASWNRVYVVKKIVISFE